MQIFDHIIDELQALNFASQGGLNMLIPPSRPWPSGKHELVLASDMAVELGHPRDKSISFLVWTNDAGKIKNNQINLAGPDIQASQGCSLPFAKVIMIGGHGFNDENAFERQRELELLRYDVTFKGYMMRAVSQYMREWSRISKQAVQDGFSLSFLGHALVKAYHQLDYVDAVEILMITSPEVSLLEPVAQQVTRYIGAMHKMVTEFSYDCDTCEYQDICDEADDLKTMRQRMMNGE